MKIPDHYMYDIYNSIEADQNDKIHWIFHATERAGYTYPIIYRLVILYSFWKYCKQKNIRALENYSLIEKTKDYVKVLNEKSKKPLSEIKFESLQAYSIDDFIDIYPMKIDITGHEAEGLGACMVNRLNCIFPLIFYSNEDKSVNKKHKRISALCASLVNICSKHKQLLAILDNIPPDGWSKETQIRLAEHFDSLEDYD